ncbi:hypothetical protein HDU83_000556, partial [Entophlyctis luteolus]
TLSIKEAMLLAIESAASSSTAATGATGAVFASDAAADGSDVMSIDSAILTTTSLCHEWHISSDSFGITNSDT